MKFLFGFVFFPKKSRSLNWWWLPDPLAIISTPQDAYMASKQGRLPYVVWQLLLHWCIYEHTHMKKTKQNKYTYIHVSKKSSLILVCKPKLFQIVHTYVQEWTDWTDIAAIEFSVSWVFMRGSAEPFPPTHKKPCEIMTTFKAVILATISNTHPNGSYNISIILESYLTH